MFFPLRTSEIYLEGEGQGVREEEDGRVRRGECIQNAWIRTEDPYERDRAAQLDSSRTHRGATVRARVVDEGRRVQQTQKRAGAGASGGAESRGYA